MRITRAQRVDEMLSYFTGLAPVGNTVEVPRDWILQDLSIGSAETYAVLLRDLIASGRVHRVSRGYGGTTGVFTVLRRLEEA